MDFTTGFDKQSLMSNKLMELGFRSKAGRKRKTKDGAKCLVCGGKSIGLNFGVQTCSPCKAFFRRNAVKLGTYEFRCSGDGDCPVTSDTRRQCNCCRLAKCFRVGMDRKAIRTEDQRVERIRLIEYNRQKRAEKQLEEEKSLQNTNKQLMIRPSGILLHSQTNASTLSMNDQSLLTNIFHEYKRICQPLTYKEHLSMPVNETLTLQRFMNASAKMYMGLINYLKAVPEFNYLSIDSKMSLIKSNLNQVVRMHSTFIMKTVTPDLDKDSPVFLHIFPENLYKKIRDSSTVLIPFVHDPILIKLYIIILMLSSHMKTRFERNSTLNEDENSSLNILHVQNIYTDLLWRYILSRCSNYRYSVKLFSSLITNTLYSQLVQFEVDKFMSTSLANQNQSLEPIIQTMWTFDEKTFA